LRLEWSNQQKAKTKKGLSVKLHSPYYGVEPFSFAGDTLVGVLWIPSDSDPLANIQTVQEHFKQAKFTRQVAGWDQQRHSYSNNASYYDSDHGILFTTNEYNHSVNAIGFNIPSANRDLSSEKNK